MELPRIKIGGRSIPLLLTTWETLAIMEEIGCTPGQLKDQVFGLVHNIETDEYRCTISEDREKLKKFGTLVRILGNAGLETEGEKPDLTDKWVLRNINPGMVILYVMLVATVVNDAMKMEVTQNNTGPVDEILAEENAKKEPRSLLTGESAPADSSPG